MAGRQECRPASNSSLSVFPPACSHLQPHVGPLPQAGRRGVGQEWVELQRQLAPRAQRQRQQVQRAVLRSAAAGLPHAEASARHAHCVRHGCQVGVKVGLGLHAQTFHPGLHGSIMRDQRERRRIRRQSRQDGEGETLLCRQTQMCCRNTCAGRTLPGCSPWPAGCAAGSLPSPPPAPGACGAPPSSLAAQHASGPPEGCPVLHLCPQRRVVDTQGRPPPALAPPRAAAGLLPRPALCLLPRDRPAPQWADTAAAAATAAAPRPRLPAPSRAAPPLRSAAGGGCGCRGGAAPARKLQPTRGQVLGAGSGLAVPLGAGNASC